MSYFFVDKLRVCDNKFIQCKCMGTAKDYLSIQESFAKIESILERLAKISYYAFINEYDGELIEHTIKHAIDIRDFLETSLVTFFIENNLENTPILSWYENIFKISAEQASISKDNLYYGYEIENYLEPLANGEPENLHSVLKKDLQDGLHSKHENIKKALIAWYRLKRAIEFSLRRQGDLILTTKLNQLNSYVIEQIQENGFNLKYFNLFPDLDEFQIELSFEEGKHELKIGIRSKVTETERSRNLILDPEFEQLFTNIRENIRAKISELEIETEDLELAYTADPIRRE